MASQLKRVSQATEAAVAALASREDRTFVSQLDRVVAAGLEALGEPVPEAIAPQPTATATRTRRKTGKS